MPDFRRSFPLPAYRLPDRFLDRYHFLVSQLAADTRRTRRPMLRGVARLLQMLRGVLIGQDDKVPIPRHRSGDLALQLRTLVSGEARRETDVIELAVIGQVTEPNTSKTFFFPR